MKLVATVSYKGTNYQGWQIQPNAVSVQETIEKVISKILNTEITIYGSGRTDAGVHARGQVFHFETGKDVDIDKLRYSINCLLPEDIHILALKEADNDFHSRYSAKGKHYSYTIKFGENDPFDNEFVYTYSKSLDVEAFIKAFEPFNGEHNLQDFTSKEEDEDGFVRRVKISTLVENDIVKVDFVGNGFMKYMIRFLVGAALAVAESKESIDFIKYHLNSDKKREIISYKAPAMGLVLEEVNY